MDNKYTPNKSSTFGKLIASLKLKTWEYSEKYHNSHGISINLFIFDAHNFCDLVVRRTII